MANQKASDAAKQAILAHATEPNSGWIFYALKNGKPLAEAAQGFARRMTVHDDRPALAYGIDTIVHVASVAKLVCGIAVLRLVEEWNEIADQLGARRGETSHGTRKYRGPARPGDEGLIASVEVWDARIDLDDKIFPFLKDHLKWMQIRNGIPHFEGPQVTGRGVDQITIRELLTHTSGLRDGSYDAGLARLKLKKEDIKVENTFGGKAKFNLIQDCAVVLANDVVDKANIYCNDGFTLLGALIQFQTATRYEDWVRKKLTFDQRFHDIARHPVDQSRAAQYYLANEGMVSGANHPDYADFSAAGGYYTSARAFCDWIDAILQQEAFHGRPLLRAPERLMDFKDGHLGPGCDRYDLGPLRGFAKNGGTGSAGNFAPVVPEFVRLGSTNAIGCYLKGFGKDRVVAFFQVNDPTNANPMLDAGLAAIRDFIYRPSVVPVAIPELTSRPRLRGRLWLPAATAAGVETHALRFTPAMWRGVTAQDGASGATVKADRTDLLNGASSAFSLGNVQIVELTGRLTLPPGNYQFRLTSDDGAMLFFDDALQVDNDGDHSMRSVTSPTWIQFPAAGRKLRIFWYNSGGGGGLYLEQIPQAGRQPQTIPANCFSTDAVKLQPPRP